MPPLVVTPLPGLPEVPPGADLPGLILDGIARAELSLQPGDVVVVAQKIVSKAEGRRVALAGVVPSRDAESFAAVAQKGARVVELALREAAELVRCCPGVFVVEDRRGLVLANAGIDASNVGGEGGDAVLLLPLDPDASATRIRDGLRRLTGLHPRVMIIDSLGCAWRSGTVGTAIGLAGLPGLVDLRGRPDHDGRLLRSSELAAADELAAAASLMMGQAGVGRPVVHVRGFPYPLRPGSADELRRPRQGDLFR